jgi:hypothetical protein
VRTGTAALCLLAWACAPSGPHSGALGNPEGTQAAASPQPVRFQFIYVIHGDAGYTWYDAEGTRRSADEDAVAQAQEVARDAPSAEVFIFHQKPAPVLGMFPGPDGTMLQYRGGRQIRGKGYRRAADDVDMRAEAALFRTYAAPSGPAGTEPPARIFAYFGHEIPVTPGLRHSRSRNDTAFSAGTFARGLAAFTGPADLLAGRADGSPPGAKPFSLIVLSACHGGTPPLTLALAPYAPFLLASAGEIHLSYLDTRAFARLAGETAGPLDSARAGEWARQAAAESFARLIQRTSTPVALGIYETGRAAAYLEARRDAWEPPSEATGAIGSGQRKGPAAYRDCAEEPGFGEGGSDAGVTLLYRAAKFGAAKSKAFRSGWECPEPAAAGKRLGAIP